jgi:uncharacterized membrane protein YoaK (UPF0700 family)
MSEPAVPSAGASAKTGADDSAGAKDRRSLLRTLVVLTLISGLVDAVSYLGLGRVFTANMTGNIVVLGFAAAGAPGFSMAATLTSLGAFLAGAVLAGQATRRISSRSRLLVTAMGVEAVAVGVAAIVAYQASTVATGWGRYTAIAVLAVAMGVRNAVIRHLSVRDMTTTVLTQTLTGLAADSSLAGGGNPRAGRRSAAVAAMLTGAIVGAALYLHRGPGLPLAVSAVATAATAIAFQLSGAAIAKTT